MPKGLPGTPFRRSRGLSGIRLKNLIGKKHFYDLFAPEVREELKKGAFKVFCRERVVPGLPQSELKQAGENNLSGDKRRTGAGFKGECNTDIDGADTDVTERNHAEQALRKPTKNSGGKWASGKKPSNDSAGTEAASLSEL